MHDEHRNRAISDDVLDVIRAGRSPLILTERQEHLEWFAFQLTGRVRHVVVLRGGRGNKERAAVAGQLAGISADEERVLLGTGKYIGEGFDDARLDTLFLTLPVSWRGTVAQYVGRLHRLCDGKRDVRVYDYADLNVRMLSRMFDRQCQGYESLGYDMVLPASAIPGWPADVQLPSDPLWKRDYAASVRRLVRDGVEGPLARLFVEAARPIPSEAEGAARARSASEAFLYRRLETLAQTHGRFRLNAELAIPFDGQGPWTSIFSAKTLVSPSRSMERCISVTLKPIVEIGTRTASCRSTGTRSCASSRKISARTWIRCWTRFFGRSTCLFAGEPENLRLRLAGIQAARPGPRVGTSVSTRDLRRSMRIRRQPDLRPTPGTAERVQRASPTSRSSFTETGAE